MSWTARKQGPGGPTPALLHHSITLLLCCQVPIFAWPFPLITFAPRARLTPTFRTTAITQRTPKSALRSPEPPTGAAGRGGAGGEPHGTAAATAAAQAPTTDKNPRGGATRPRAANGGPTPPRGERSAEKRRGWGGPGPKGRRRREQGRPPHAQGRKPAAERRRRPGEQQGGCPASARSGRPRPRPRRGCATGPKWRKRTHGPTGRAARAAHLLWLLASASSRPGRGAARMPLVG